MRRLVLGLAAAGLAHAGVAAAQDMNDQAFQVGGRPALMGGAVVGGVRDATAAYYNPGALAFVDEPNVAASATVLQYGRIKIDDALGRGQEIDADLIDLVPLFVGGSFKLGAEREWALGYALVTRQQFDNALRGAVVTVGEMNAGAPGDETFIGQYDDSRRVQEQWGLLTVARRIGDRLGIGGGPILSLRQESRTQRFSTNLENATTVPATQIFTVTQFFDIEYYQVSLLGKLGVAWEPVDGLKLGATITAPSVRIYGRGEEMGEIVLATSLAGVGDVNVRSLQQGLSTRYRSPLRIAGGVEWTITPRWLLGVSAEYVGPLGARPVVQNDPGSDVFAGTPQFIGSSPNLLLLDERDWVVNGSAGVEYRASERWSVYTGAWTDFSPTDVDDSKAMIASDAVGQPLAVAAVDVYHAVIGVSRRTADRLFAVGLTGAYGTGRVAANLDFVDPAATGGGGVDATVTERRTTFWTGGLVLSFTQVF